MQPVSPLVWALTLAGIAGLLALDFFVHGRRPHIPTTGQAAGWTAAYVSVAAGFGIGTLLLGGVQMGTEFFAGYVTEMSLSVDNLFVFLIIMTSFRVPRAQQPKVLMFGIVVSLVVRSGFIFLGVALINAFSAVFYVFGVLLLVTAVNLLRPEVDAPADESAASDNWVIRLARRFLHTSDRYDGHRLVTTVDGRRTLTPMLLVMVAIGGTDVMFALDSIPAIFGLTQSGYVVFTAVAFSLMGLRQLYFLIDGLLDRLVHLRYGLAAILALIGVKLFLHALGENSLPLVNGGRHVPVSQITTQQSLAVIVGTLTVTVIASLASPKGKALTTIRNVRRHAHQYLDEDFLGDPALRDAHFDRLVREEDLLLALPARFHPLIRDEQELLDLLAEAHRAHDGLAPGATGGSPAGGPLRGRPSPHPRLRRPDAAPDEPSGE